MNRSTRPSVKRRRIVALVVLISVLALLTVMTVIPPRLHGATPRVRCVSPLALRGDLNSNPQKQLVAQMMVSSAEYSTLHWEDEVGALHYNVEGSDTWNRGYTGGIIGFTSKTSSMAELVRRYTAAQPLNELAPFLPVLEAVNGTSSTTGLGPDFEQAWQDSASDPVFGDTQLRLAHEWDRAPALDQANRDGLRSLGQFAYYDAMVQHGSSGFEAVHQDALLHATPPSNGGDETAWLTAWFTAREEYMLREVSAGTATRVSTAQRGLLADGALDLTAPLQWDIYGDHFSLRLAPFCTWS